MGMPEHPRLPSEAPSTALAWLKLLADRVPETVGLRIGVSGEVSGVVLILIAIVLIM